MKNKKPEIELKPMDETVVFCNTEEEKETLLKIYQSAGWKWKDGILETERKELVKKYDCFEITDSFNYLPKAYYQGRGFEIIPFDGFLEIQKISIHKLIEIVNYFSKEK